MEQLLWGHISLRWNNCLTYFSACFAYVCAPCVKDDVKEGLRVPHWSKKGRYQGAGGVSVLSLQYGDFRAALTFGLGLSLGDALDLEMDRVE